MSRLDALHTQTDNAQQIIDAGGHYVLTVKNNNPKLRAAIENLPGEDVPIDHTTCFGHGRRETRSIRVLQIPDWITYPDATQVAQLRRTVTRARKTSWEVTYLITSAAADAQLLVLADWSRGHRGIENRLRWVRDVTFDEDRSEVRAGNGPRIMASLRNLAIVVHRLASATSLGKATRSYARNPERALTTLLTS